MLFFKKRFFEAIESGTKTTTLRCWSHRRVKPGSVHTVPWLGRLHRSGKRRTRIGWHLISMVIVDKCWRPRRSLSATIS